MKAKKPQPCVIRDAKAIRLLASPLRQAILDWIAASGAATVAELSEHLRRPADRLYYHVRLLERAGLLVGHESEAASGRPEMRFDVPGRPMVLRYERANRGVIKTVVGGVLRSARADFDKALADPAVRVEGPARDLWAGRMEALLTEDDLKKLNAALGNVFAALGQSRSPTPEAKVYQFTWVVSPVTR